jgi:hypothetical protein
LGWALATLAAEWGIDEIQRWMDDKTGVRHQPHEDQPHHDYTEPNRPDASSSFVTGECRDPIEEAEFQELEDAARMDCDEEW